MGSGMNRNSRTSRAADSWGFALTLTWEVYDPLLGDVVDLPLEVSGRYVPESEDHMQHAWEEPEPAIIEELFVVVEADGREVPIEMVSEALVDRILFLLEMDGDLVGLAAG